MIMWSKTGKSSQMRVIPLLLVATLTACGPAPKPEHTGDTATPPTDSGETGTDTSGPEDTADTGDTASKTVDFSDIDTLIEGYLKTAPIPGLGAALTVGGEVIWADGYGWADIENKIPATGDTAFMLASVSKTFVATALMQRIEEGAFELDTPVNDLLDFTLDNPHLKDEVVTVRHVASHTASLCDAWVWGSPGSPGGLYSEGDSEISLRDFLMGYLIDGGEWYGDMNFCNREVGTHYEYSNIGADLAGYLLESSGTSPLDDHSDAYIFEPLGMENTGWHLADHDVSNVAVPYDYMGGEYIPYEKYGYPDYPCGQLRSSAYDLARYLAAYANGGTLGDEQILQTDSIDEMFALQAPGVEMTQGVFWYWSVIGDRDVVGHSGGDYGVSTEIVLDPATGVGVVLLFNTYGNAAVWSAHAAIQEALFVKGESIAKGD